MDVHVIVNGVAVCIDYAMLQRASRDVQQKCGYSMFEARSGLVATWNNVTYYTATRPYAVKCYVRAS